MSVNTFIPTIWSGTLLLWLRKNLVFAQAGIVNRDYEGDIAQKGDTVKIASIGPVSVKRYVRNTDIDDPEQVDIDDQMLQITEEDYFNFAVDDVDKRQVGLPLVSGAMERAAYGIADTADNYIAQLMKHHGTQVTDFSMIPGTLDAYGKLVAAGVALDNAKIPSQGRFAIVKPAYHGTLRVDDRFVKYDAVRGTDSVKADALLNGLIGEAAGFTVLKSLNVPAGVDAILGSSISTSYAEQLTEVEAFRPQKRFSDAVKGLHVYGGKVTRPEGIVYLAS